MEKKELKELLDKCQKLCEDDKHQEIIDLISTVKPEDYCPEIESELGRAYMNVGDDVNPDNMRKALEYLSPHAEYFKGDHRWNFRMGYANYFLNNEGIAFHYFDEALKAREGDQDTIDFINDCVTILSLPTYKKPFKEKVKESFALFEEKDEELRELIGEKDHDNSEKVIEIVNSILGKAFNYWTFSVQKNINYEMVLFTKASKVTLMELLYYKQHMPASLRENWDIIVGDRINENAAIGYKDKVIKPQDIQVWVEQGENKNKCQLFVYNDTLFEYLQEDEDKAYDDIDDLVCSMISEIGAMNVLTQLEILDCPRDEVSIPLSELASKMEELDLDITISAQDYFNTIDDYQSSNPNENPECIWRTDVYKGSTNMIRVVSNYFDNNESIVDRLHSEGIAIGSIAFSLENFTEEEKKPENLVDFKESIQREIQARVSSNELIIIGEATGVSFGYIDIVAFGDLREALLKIREIFDEMEDVPTYFVAYRSYTRGIRLKTNTVN